MINNFRRNGFDSFLLSGALLVLLTPLFSIVSDKIYVSSIDKIFYVFTNCFFWFLVPMAITQLLYEKYLKEIDELVILNPQKVLFILSCLLLAAYYLFFNMMIIYNVRSPGFFAPVLLLFAPIVYICINRVGIGRNYLIFGFNTLDLNSIVSYRKETVKRNTFKLIIYFDDERYFEIKHYAAVIDKLELKIAYKLSQKK
jgi:hypothetical protein